MYHIGNERLPVELGWTPQQEEIVGTDLGDLIEVIIMQSPADVPLTFAPKPAMP